MKAAIVLLSDYAVQNDVRRVVFDLNTRYGIPLYASQLPCHVSLKQPFAFNDIDALEKYFDDLAAEIAPFNITLDRYYYVEWSGFGILGLNVVETPELRQLHNLVNSELQTIFKDTAAPFDGSAYHFHMTIEMGKIGPVNGFKAYFDSLPEPEVQVTFTSRELALFYYPDDERTSGSFITYRVKPLSGKRAYQ